MDSIKAACEVKRNKIVFADALQDQKHGRGVARIGDEVWPPGWHSVGLAWHQSDLFLGVLQKDADRSSQYIERIMDVVVTVPRHLLGGTNLQLGDAKTRARGMNSAALDLVEGTGILHSLHVRPPCPAWSSPSSSPERPIIPAWHRRA